MSAHSWNQPYRRCFWPFFRWSHRRVRTIRFYDPSIDAWRSTWVEPVNCRVRRFTGRPADGDILLVSNEEDPQLRWRFTDIGPDSFTWQGEASHDGGRTWVFEEQMRATRHRSR